MGINETTDLPSRRTALKLAAWSVPVVALTVATPAAAASDENSIYYVYQSYAGWTGGRFVLEAFIYLRSSQTPVAGLPVSWRVLETGQVFSSTTTDNGFARVDTPPSGVVGDPVLVEITSVDASKIEEVQGTRPV